MVDVVEAEVVGEEAVDQAQRGQRINPAVTETVNRARRSAASRRRPMPEDRPATRPAGAANSARARP